MIVNITPSSSTQLIQHPALAGIPEMAPLRQALQTLLAKNCAKCSHTSSAISSLYPILITGVKHVTDKHKFIKIMQQVMNNETITCCKFFYQGSVIEIKI